MTDVLSPPAKPDSRPDVERTLTGLYTAVVVGAGAALVGLVVITAVVLLGWAATSDAPATTALRVAGQAWLAAQHSPIGTASGTIDLVPMGLVALPAGLLCRAGILLGRANEPSSLLEAARLTLAVAATYGAFAVAISLASGSAAARVGTLSALLGAIVIAFVGCGAGVIYGGELAGPLLTRLPAGTGSVLRAAAVAVFVLLACGTALAGASLALHSVRATDLSRSLGGGLAGGIIVLLLGLLYAPNAAVCGLSVAAGPGFGVGSGTSVTVFGTHLGPVPAFPLLAALPEKSSPLLYGALIVPVIAGVLAGTVIGRLPGSGRTILARVGGCGAVVGVLVAALCVLAGGSLGAGRMSAIGPSVWQVGGAAAVEIAIFALAAAFLVRRGQPELAIPVVRENSEPSEVIESSESSLESEPEPEPESKPEAGAPEDSTAESVTDSGEPEVDETDDDADSDDEVEPAEAEPTEEIAAESDDDSEAAEQTDPPAG
jgi:hypothetical protein